jgi:hypothetical protein
MGKVKQSIFITVKRKITDGSESVTHVMHAMFISFTNNKTLTLCVQAACPAVDTYIHNKWLQRPALGTKVQAS